MKGAAVYRLIPHIPFLLSAEQLQQLHVRALRILDQVGLKVSDPRLARGCGGGPACIGAPTG